MTNFDQVSVKQAQDRPQQTDTARNPRLNLLDLANDDQGHGSGATQGKFGAESHGWKHSNCHAGAANSLDFGTADDLYGKTDATQSPMSPEATPPAQMPPEPMQVQQQQQMALIMRDYYDAMLQALQKDGSFASPEYANDFWQTFLKDLSRDYNMGGSLPAGGNDSASDSGSGSQAPSGDNSSDSGSQTPSSGSNGDSGSQAPSSGSNGDSGAGSSGTHNGNDTGGATGGATGGSDSGDTPAAGGGTDSPPTAPPETAPAQDNKIVETKNNYYVSANGSDSGDGSKDHPWKTLQHAFDDVKTDAGGTTIHVGAGNYGGLNVLKKHGDDSGLLQVVSDQKFGAKVDGDIENFRSNVTIAGFEVTNPDGWGGITSGINTPGTTNVKILDNYIHDVGTVDGVDPHSGGIELSSDNSLVDGNIINNIGPQKKWNQQHGVYVSAHNDVVTNNQISNVSGWGVHEWHKVGDATIENNTIFGARMGGIVIGAADGTVKTDNNHVDNNIIVNNGRDGQNGIEEYGSLVGSNNYYDHNLVYNNQAQNFSIKNGHQPTDSVVLNADQFANLFVNYQADGSGDYRLTPEAQKLYQGLGVHY